VFAICETTVKAPPAVYLEVVLSCINVIAMRTSTMQSLAPQVLVGCSAQTMHFAKHASAGLLDFVTSARWTISAVDQPSLAMQTVGVWQGLGTGVGSWVHTVLPGAQAHLVLECGLRSCSYGVLSGLHYVVHLWFELCIYGF
jgi:hypothetical protein